MTQKAEFIIEGNDQSAKAAWDRQQNAINAVIGRIGQMEAKLASADKKQASWTDKAISGAAGMVAGYVSVQGALGLIEKEWQAIEARQNRALETQKTLAQVQRGAVLNLGVDPNWNADKLVKTLNEMSKRSGVDEKTLTRVAGDALSARGDSSIESTMTAIEAASKILPDDAEGLRTLTAATMDLQKSLGGSAASNIGYLQSVGATSRVTSLKFMAENATPAIAGLTKFGGTKEEAGALFSMFSGSMVDTTGSQSKTSSLSLAKQLETFLPKLATTDERIQALQSNQALAQKFLKESSFEVAALPAVRGLLAADAGTAERRAYDSAKKAIVGGAAAESLYTDTIRQVDALPAIQNARKAQMVDAAGQRLSGANITGANTAVGRDAVQTMLDESGAGFLTSQVAKWGYFFRTSAGQAPGEAAAAQMEWRAGQLETPNQVQIGTGGVSMPTVATETEASKALKEAAAMMRDASKSLEKTAAKPPVKMERPHVPRTPVSAAAGTGGR